MSTREPISVGEWYHCYSRGVEKRRVFENDGDYQRFLIQMFAGNSESSVHVSNLRCKTLADATSLLRENEKKIVDIGAFALMPNHFHMLLQETRAGGIARFMQKLITGYSMYFNIGRERTGALFSGTYKSRHVDTDRYLKHVVSYIHLNPVEIVDAQWKEGRGNTRLIKKFLSKYQYSSLPLFKSRSDPRRRILSEGIFDLYDKVPSLDKALEEAGQYYRETNIKV